MSLAGIVISEVTLFCAALWLRSRAAVWPGIMSTLLLGSGLHWGQWSASKPLVLLDGVNLFASTAMPMHSFGLMQIGAG